MVDWDWEDVLDRHEKRHLDEIIEMEDLRIEQPIVWMVLTGTSRSREIAAKLGWPHDFVIAELRHYKKQGRLFDECGSRHMLWRVHPEAQDLLRLDRWRRGEAREGGIFNPVENQGD